MNKKPNQQRTLLNFGKNRLATLRFLQRRTNSEPLFSDLKEDILSPANIRTEFTVTESIIISEWYAIRTIYPQLDPKCTFEEFKVLREKVHSGEIPPHIWPKITCKKSFISKLFFQW